MKREMKWMALAAAILLSTSAWAAVWPDDPALLFNMNFEVFDNGAHTTTSAKPAPPNALVGTVIDYNTACPNVFGELSRTALGYDANFAEMHDLATGAGVYSNVPSPNDLKLTVPSGTKIFDLGPAPLTPDVEEQHTWAFWFNAPTFNQGTIIRHAYNHLEYPDFGNYVMEIRIFGGKLQFYHKNNSLRMETASTLSDLELTTDEWHHAAVVIDRTDSKETSVPTKQLSTKIYIDGLEVPVIVNSLNLAYTMNVDPEYNSDLWIGAGEREFDGLLDDVRLYERVLTPVEVSLLNQPDTSIPRALLPIPRSTDVIIGTTLTWIPASPAPTVQDVYFGTDPCALTPVVTGGNGTLGTVTNAQLGGLLDLDTEYYWYVKSDDVNGPLWSFTTETGRALNPSPYDGEEDVNNENVDLLWATPTTATYDVYVSTVFDEANDSNCNDIALRGHNLTDPCLVGFDPCDIGDKGQIYYWRVDCNYVSVGLIKGDVWSFRTDPYELVFNTSGYVTTYADHDINAYGCEIHGGTPSWTPVTTGSLDGACADGNAIAVFNFNGPNGFSYDRRYDIIVVPAYRARDVNSNFTIFPTPLAIHTTGNFYFDGRIQIAGDDVLTTSQTTTFARSGGFPGPKNNLYISIYGDAAVPGNTDIAGYMTQYIFNDSGHPNFHTRFSSATSTSTHWIFDPTAFAKRIFGPGEPVNPPYKGGGGGGAGGRGGDAGRGYFFGVDSGGPSYSDEEVPIPFGGSAGGWGATSGGAAGGGGIEIIASGDVTFDSNSQIRAFGGGQVYSSIGGDGAGGGGGGGGSVRIIASGSVDLKGSINVNGGKGANASDKVPNPSGGGGGGRVAIFYGAGDAPNTNNITVYGGAKGTYNDSTYGIVSLAQDGQDGTIYVASGAPNSAKKASAPTPANGDVKVYISPDPCTAFKLKWYSGYGGTNDVVKCDTSNPPTIVRGSVAATRGQHSLTLPFNVLSGTTYYWKVETDGVSSDIWSFKAVGWYCPVAIQYANPHPGGLEWDANHNCVLDFEDFGYFVQDWLNSDFGQYTIDNPDFARFGSEFGYCVNRSDGCPGYTNPNP